MTSIAQQTKQRGKPSTPRRVTKGEALLARRRQLALKFKHLGGSLWRTVSESRPGATHLTDVAARTCTCRATVECWHLQLCDWRVEQDRIACRMQIQALVDQLGLDRSLAVLKRAARTRAAHPDDLSSAPGYSSYYGERAS